MRAIDNQPPAADQPRIGALAQHLREQLLKHRGVREPLRLRVTERRVIRQRLRQTETDKPAD